MAQVKKRKIRRHPFNETSIKDACTKGRGGLN